MDNLTWMFLIVSFVSTILALTLISHSEQLDIINVVIQIFGSLLSQGISFPIRSPRVTIIICVWMLGLIVVSNGYSSILSVQIIKPVLPNNYPSDLESVAKSNLKKFGYTSELEYGEADLELGLYLNELSQSNTRILQDTSAYMKKIVSELEDIDSPAFFTESLLDSTFVLITPQNVAKFYKDLFQSMGKYTPVDKVLSDYIYVDTFYYLRETFLQSNILFVVNALHESGVINEWEKANLNLDLYFLTDYADYAGNIIGSSTDEDEFLKEVQVRLMTNSEPEPITLNKLSELFYVLILMLSICIIPFCLENVI